MADPLSIAASIIGIAAAGAKVSISLYQFADEVGSAAKDARHMGNEISSFCSVLRMLGTTLEEADAISVLRCRDMADEMSARCLAIFIDIIDVVQDLRGYIGIPGDSGFKWMRKVRWALQKPRILYLRASLESYKNTLNLMLATLDLARRAAKRRNSTVSIADQESESHQQSLIESLELASRASIAELEELENQTPAQDTEFSLTGNARPESVESGALGAAQNRNPYTSISSDDRSSFVESVREELESHRSRRRSLISTRSAEGHSLPRVSFSSTRNSSWLSEEQLNLRRWSSQLLDASDEAPSRRTSRLSLDSRRSRRATQIFGGMLQAPPLSTVDEIRVPTGVEPEIALTAGHSYQGKPSSQTHSPFHLTLLNGEFSEVTTAIKLWLDALSVDDCAKAWQSFLPVGYTITEKAPVEGSAATVEEPQRTAQSNSTDEPRHPQSSTDPTEGVPSVEIFKTFRVNIDDPCHKVLPIALKKYNITNDWRIYDLYIVHGDQERCLGLNERPLILYKQLDREGKKPMFMLRKHASPVEGYTTTIS